MTCPICGSEECMDLHPEYRIQSWIKIEHREKIRENTQKMKFMQELEDRIKQKPVIAEDPET